nr:hypothetical protein CFP56_70056 [Quercus suber]
MDGGHMQQPSISLDQQDSPSLHPLPPLLIPPHSVSHSANAAPINLPPRTTTPTAPTAPSCLGILPDSDKCNGSQFVQDLQEMRSKCCLSSMEGEVHGEVVPKNVLQGDGGFESHVDVSQGKCGIKTKPTVGRLRGSCSNLVGQDNVVGLNGLNQESFDCEFLVGQDNIVGLNGLNQESFDCEFLVGQDHVGLYDLNQVSVDPDIDNL